MKVPQTGMDVLDLVGEQAWNSIKFLPNNQLFCFCGVDCLQNEYDFDQKEEVAGGARQETDLDRRKAESF